jgi:hypothetical protein
MVSSRRTAAASALVLMVAGLVTLAAQCWFATAHPTDQSWRAGAAFVKKHIDSGDVIRVHPAWTESPLPYLQSVGTTISPQNFPVPEDFIGVDRIWILSDRDRTSDAIDRLPFDLADDAIETRYTEGNVAVLSVRLPDNQLPRHSLLERLPDADVRVESQDGGTDSCDRWDKQDWRWQCGGASRSWVGRDLRYFKDDPHRCIRAYPPSGERALVITFPEIPSGEMFRLRAGLTTLTALADRGSSVTMNMESNVWPTRTVDFGKDTASWHAWDIARPAGESIELTMRITAENTHKRFFCINGWTYSPAIAEVGDEWRERRHR